MTESLLNVDEEQQQKHHIPIKLGRAYIRKFNQEN